MKNWDELVGNEEISHKPRIAVFVESFEKKYKGEIPDELLTNAACLAVALYLFGPLEDEELNVYAAAVKKRVQDYRDSLH